MSDGRTPSCASSIILTRSIFGRGLPLMKTPPNWFTLPWPRINQTNNVQKTFYLVIYYISWANIFYGKIQGRIEGKWVSRKSHFVAIRPGLLMVFWGMVEIIIDSLIFLTHELQYQRYLFVYYWCMSGLEFIFKKKTRNQTFWNLCKWHWNDHFWLIENSLLA